jgi:predicted GNAT family N-acyltransferase
LTEQCLDTAIHDCAGFDRGVSQTYVLVDGSAPTQVLGYYSLSAEQLEAESLSDAERKRLPRYPIPCILMGRLAVSSSSRGQGHGRLLVGLAVERCLKARQEVGADVLVVDAKDEGAADFYRHYGLMACRDAALTLYLAL